MNYWYLALAAVVAYLIGNLQSAVFLSRWKFHDDIRRHGSGNAGSTNMLRVYGWKPGAITFAGDFLKGVLAVLAGRWIAGENGACVASVFVALGHCFPVFLGFRGGKGVASSLAIAWMLNPLFGAIVSVFAAVMAYLTKTISIVSLSGITLYLLLTLIFRWNDTAMVLAVAALWLIVVLRHTDNIKRLFAGEECKVSAKKKPENDAKSCD